MTRRSKIAVLNAKKTKKKLNYNDNPIFINEHLSPSNRQLFALASQKKYTLNFKFLWTRNGSVYMRKDEHSEIIPINDETCLTMLN